MKLKYTIMLITSILFACEKRNGIYEEYYNNGKISVWADTSDPANTVAKKFYINGQLEREIHLSYGEYNGIYIEYYENGKVKNIENYNMGRRQGKAISFYETGDIVSVSFFQDGEVVKGVQYSPLGEIMGTIENKRTRVFFPDGKIGLIICNNYQDTSKYNRIKFDSLGNVISYGGNLYCLTYEDTILLNKTNPNWKEEVKKFENIY